MVLISGHSRDGPVPDRGLPVARGAHPTRFAERLQVERAAIHVSDLGHRWASCGAGGRLNYHWCAILLSGLLIIDYLIVHEIVHLHEPHHSPAFWQRIERALPEYAVVGRAGGVVRSVDEAGEARATPLLSAEGLARNAGAASAMRSSWQGTRRAWTSSS